MTFHLQPHLDRLYEQSDRRFTFQAGSSDEVHQWQSELRQALREHLGIAGRALPDDVNATELHSIRRDGYTETKYALDSGEVQIPVYILRPDAPLSHKAVMAFPGHGDGVQQILDAQTYGEEGYAGGLAQAGYLVCTVEQQGFGERVTDQVSDGDRRNSCYHLSFEYLMQGRTLLGERVWEGMLALSFLLRQPDIDPASVGCVGHSGGGTTTLFLSALDERIITAVVSCYFCAFRQSILKVRHCTCNYVPGLLQLAESGEFAGLIAPRAVRFVAGEHDPIFAISGVHEQYEVVQQIYSALDASDRCSLHVHEGGHAFRLKPALDWFGQWL